MFKQNKKNNVYPCKPYIYYIKVGFKGVKIISVCFRDAVLRQLNLYYQLLLKKIATQNTKAYTKWHVDLKLEDTENSSLKHTYIILNPLNPTFI